MSKKVSKTSFTPLIIDDRIISTSRKKTFCCQFHAEYTTSSFSSIYVHAPHAMPENNFRLQPIKKIFPKLDLKKSSGFYGIPSIVQKHSRPESSSFFFFFQSFLHQISYDKRFFPQMAGKRPLVYAKVLFILNSFHGQKKLIKCPNLLMIK